MSSFDTSIVEVPVDEIHVGITIKNIRTVFDDRKIHELADSIFRDGLMHPLTIMEVEDDDGDQVFELIAGERRFRAIQHIIEHLDDEFMEDGIPCVQYVGGIHDALFVNAAENIDREQVDDVDVAGWLWARTEDGTTQSELATKLHKTLQWVNFRILFHERATEDVKEALREGLISFTAAYELSKNCDAEEQDKWIKKARTLNQKISTEEAQNAGKNTVPRPSKKERSKMLDKSEKVLGDTDSDIARGVSQTIRWVEGEITTEDFENFLGWEEESQ